MNNMTWGTGHHNKGEDGRSPEIEGYISKTVEWIMEQLDADPTIMRMNGRYLMDVLDLGCDYGYMMHRFLEAGVDAVYGVDSYYEHNPLNLDILREDMQSPILVPRIRKFAEEMRFSLVTLNHTLEHVQNPHAVMNNVSHLSERVFIAVPDANSEWAQWDSHMTCWTPKFLTHFMLMHGYKPQAMSTQSFRNDLWEIWGYFER